MGEGCARESKEAETEQDRNNPGGCRPIATLEQSGAGGIECYSTRTLIPDTKYHFSHKADLTGQDLLLKNFHGGRVQQPISEE